MKLTEVAPGLLVPDGGRNTPKSHIDKACSLIRRFRHGERIYKQIHFRGRGLWKINVGGVWRLLSRDNGKTWALLHHERYQDEICRCR